MLHPTVDELKAFAVGALVESRTREIESHLQDCLQCGETFDQLNLSGDQLVDWLRNAPTLDAANRDVGSQWKTRPAPHRTPACKSLPPEQFDRYEVGRRLGRGGMGEVYLAYDTALHRSVALKLIAPHRVKQSNDLMRFRREAESAARLQHVNIVQIFDFAEDQGDWYCAFELVDGGTLAERLESETMDLVEAAQTTATLAEGLQYAHDRQVIHRDLKPSNILFTKDGTPKIADFGLAKLLDDDVEATRDGTAIGSPCYMSPEQAAGKISKTGKATDVYSLGAVLYEMVTGRPPFRESTILATLDRVKRSTPIPPSQLRPAVDVDLDTICLKCLEKEPDQRYASAAELAADLRRYGAGLPILARKPSLWERGVKLCRRNPVGASVTAVFALVVTVFIAMLVSQNFRLGDALSESLRRLDQVQRSRMTLQMQRASSFVHTDPEQAAALLDDLDRCPLELRDFSWWCLRSRCQRRLADITVSESLTAMATSPNGAYFAAADKQGRLRFYQQGESEPFLTMPGAHRGEVTSMAFAADGATLLTGGKDGAARRWRVADGEPLTEFIDADCKGEDVNGVAVSPRDDFVATAHSDHAIRVWDLQGRLIKLLRGHAESVFCVAFSHDGKLLASGSRDETVRIWRSDDWEAPPRSISHSGEVLDLAFSPTDSQRFATASNDWAVRLFHADAEGNDVRVLGRFREKARSVAFSSDGELLAAGSFDRSISIWRVENGKPALARMDVDSVVSAIRFQRDELLVGRRDGVVTRCTVEPAWRPVRIRAHSRPINGLAFVDSEQIISSDVGGLLRASRRRDGGEVGRWRTAQGISGLCVAIDASPSHAPTAFWESDGQIHAASLTDMRRFEPRIIESDPPLLMPDAIAVSSSGSTVLIRDLDEVIGLQQPGPTDRRSNWKWSADTAALVAHSPVGSMMAVAGKSNRIWIGDSSEGELKPRFSVEAPATCLKFSPDGASLLVGLATGQATIFNLAKGGRLTLRGHRDQVACAAFSPDGMTLATGAVDGVLLWDLKLGDDRTRLAEQHDVRALAFSPTSRSLACGLNDGQVLIWNIDTRPTAANSDGTE